jgi:predicted lipoprotein with Yx(FWY)xxD motif
MRRVVVGLCVLAAGCASPDATDSADDRSPSDRPTQSSPSASPTSPSPTGPSPTGPSPTRQKSRSGTRIITADSEYGPMLFDATGQPIYLFTAETGTRPACYDECAEAWPPVLTTGKPHAVGDARPDLVGTTRRADGRSQVTYAGHPLYFYAHEGKYQVLCHDVEEFGGTWLVVRPDGDPAAG